MFGPGIYFADTFEKSENYTQYYDYNYSNKRQKGYHKYRYMLLCEVALGEMWEKYQPEHIQDLPAPYKSVKGVGKKEPNMKQSIVLANGAIMPVGKMIQNEKPEKEEI